jgi:D-psicose/D-tagatose/L-ribulose 3-epimerase
MKLGLISSAWVGSPVGTLDGIRKTKEVGFDTIDIFADPLETRPEERKQILQACRDSGLPVISTVCVALGLVDFNNPVRAFHIDRCKQYLDLGTQLEAKNLLLVLGEYIWQREVIKPEDQWAWGVESVRTLGEYAGSLGQEIAIELEPFHQSLINSVPKMSAFLDEVGHPAVKANVDISHLALVHSPAGELKTLRGRIAHVHLSDCDGKVHGDLPPGRGVVDFPPYLKALAEADFKGTVSIELEYSPEPEKIVDWVAEAYRETDRLMRDQNLRST